MRSRLNNNEDPRISTEDGKKSIDSIHFKFWHEEVMDKQKRLYARKVTYDLITHDMPVPQLLLDQQKALKNVMRMEHQYRELGEAIAKCDEDCANTIALINNVPCILHLENRVGIKIFGAVIQRGLSKALDGILYPEIRDVGRRFDSFFTAVNHIVNTTILGTMQNPSQWECPCDRTCRELGIICLDNVRTQKIVNGIDHLLDLCIVNDEERDQWKYCISEYHDAMILLCKKLDLTNDEIKQFQQHVDNFYVTWIDLLSQEGITNYIHMLGAGHIGEYLLYHHNLYKHSQQGWEAFNSLLKTFFLPHWQRRCW